MVHTPSAPSATQTAAAQAEYNQNTAETQQLLNMTNQVTPYGTLTYDQTGNSTFTGADGKTYTVPQYTQTTTLNPQQQATLNSTESAAGNIANTADSLSSSGLSSLSQPVDTSGAPALQTSLGSDYSTSPGSNYTSSLGSGYQTSYGGDVGQQYDEAKNAVLNQLTPTLDRQADQTKSSLIASGIRPGTAAYTAAQQGIDDSYTRAANQATMSAQDVENQLNTQAGQQAQFTDSALTNQMQSQNSAALAGQSFTNSADLQNAEFGNSANSQWLQNYYTQRDQPLNELGALLSGSQVSNATTGASSTPQTNVAGVDYSGLVEQNYQDQLSAANQTNSGLFSLGTGLMGVGGSYLGRK